MFFLTRLLERRSVGGWGGSSGRKRFMTFLLRRAEETEVTPGWRASLDLGHVRATITLS